MLDQKSTVVAVAESRSWTVDCERLRDLTCEHDGLDVVAGHGLAVLLAEPVKDCIRAARARAAGGEHDGIRMRPWKQSRNSAEATGDRALITRGVQGVDGRVADGDQRHTVGAHLHGHPHRRPRRHGQREASW